MATRLVAVSGRSREGGGGGFDGFGRTPFFAINSPWKPGRCVSDVPDFEIFRGSMPPDPLACRAFGAHKFEPLLTKSWIRPRFVTNLSCVISPWSCITPFQWSISNYPCSLSTIITMQFGWRTWLSIDNSDERWLYHLILTTSLMNSSLIDWENVLFYITWGWKGLCDTYAHCIEPFGVEYC